MLIAADLDKLLNKNDIEIKGIIATFVYPKKPWPDIKRGTYRLNDKHSIKEMIYNLALENARSRILTLWKLLIEAHCWDMLKPILYIATKHSDPRTWLCMLLWFITLKPVRPTLGIGYFHSLNIVNNADVRSILMDMSCFTTFNYSIPYLMLDSTDLFDTLIKYCQIYTVAC